MKPLFLYLYENGKTNMRFNWYLFPFAFLYRLIVNSRNLLFHIGVLKSKSFNIPIISVGNISVGGTGKTPHIEYLVSWLKKDYKLATLSRGYKRKTKGFLLATNHSDVKSIGDEPLQLKSKFKDIQVAVDEKRVNGVEQLLKLKESPEVVLLDDAYQHRHIKPGLNILLIDYNRPIHKDYMLPVGRLREPAYNHSRANIIIMTKCPSSLKPIDYRIMQKDLNIYPYQSLFYTTFKYQKLVSVFNQTPPKELKSVKGHTALVITGIANPNLLYKELEQNGLKIEKMKFSDHHSFSMADVQKIVGRFMEINTKDKVIICTEKDAIRLKEFSKNSSLVKTPIYYLPIEVDFLNNGETEFQSLVKKYCTK